MGTDHALTAWRMPLTQVQMGGTEKIKKDLCGDFYLIYWAISRHISHGENEAEGNY